MLREARRLLSWYDREKRPLPWRVDADPYRVWVSEILLQQTRVEVVAPRYLRFLSRFPDVAALAAAREEEVLAEWSGLGYYRRARTLHAAARQIVAAGSWPRSAGEWRALPGVGAYTAAAVASIALGEAVPVVDGNVRRVMRRRFGLAARAGGEARFAELAARFLAAGRPGEANQALMELGATVCLPRRPRCPRCPLRRGCRAHAQGNPERFDAPARRTDLEHIRGVAALVEERGRILLFRRPAGAAWLAEFWELPWGSTAQELAGRYGGRWALGDPLGSARHSITHRRFELELCRARWSKRREAPEAVPERRWVRRGDLGTLPTSSLVDKLLSAAD